MSFDFRIGSEQVQGFQLSVSSDAVESDTEESTDSLTIKSGNDGDTVSISSEAKELLQKAGTDAMKSSGTESSQSESDSSQEEELIEKVKEQIEMLKQEVEKLKQDPEKNEEQIKAKENQLLQLQGQLTELLDQQAQNSGTSSTGGTSAQGFANSLT